MASLDKLGVGYLELSCEQMKKYLPEPDLRSYFPQKLIQYCENGHDHDKDPMQYRMKYINYTLDIGFFNRNREINEDSSFSVIG